MRFNYMRRQAKRCGRLVEQDGNLVKQSFKLFKQSFKLVKQSFKLVKQCGRLDKQMLRYSCSFSFLSFVCRFLVSLPHPSSPEFL